MMKRLGLVVVLLLPSAAGAAPKVEYLFPAGGQRGTTVAVTLGGEGKAIELLWRLFRPGGDLLLRAVHRWYLSGRKPASEPNALWEPRGEGWEETGPMIGRPSLMAPLRFRVRTPRLLRR